MSDLEQSQESSDALWEEVEALRAEHARTALRLAEALNQNIRLRREVAVLLGSRSWRITAPLRAMSAVAVRARASLRRLVRFRAMDTAVALYRRAPLPASVRLLLHKALLKLSPAAYAALRRNAGAVTPAPIEQALAIERGSADILANPAFRAGFRRLSRDLAAYAAERGGISHVIALPFFAIGGAQLTAANFARAIVHSGCGCILIAADRTIAAEPPAQISGALMVDFTDYFPDADGVAREELLFAALRFVRPQVFHAINSEVAWRLLIRSGERMRAFTRVFGAIFAFQFDWTTRQKVGYAATFLKPAFGQIDGLITDNQRFVDDAIKEYRLERERAKFHVVYNASDAVSESTRRQAQASLAGLPARISQAQRLQVLWAGRLDAEKRPELLLATAQACPDMDFHVYGARVVDNELTVQFQGLGNVYMQGPYTSAQEVLSRREHHVMMFTSRWEGLANVLIEFGALGVPIVAATVGGVGELITDSTGYAVGERPVTDDYVVALRAVKASPATAARKAAKLLDLVNERHSGISFAAAVAQIPGYIG